MNFRMFIHGSLLLGLIQSACTAKKETKTVVAPTNGCTVQSETAEQIVLSCLQDDGKTQLITVKSGASGQNGIDGHDGKNGTNGRDGKDGNDGRDGKDGNDGRDGKDGNDGRDGKDGKDGQDGEPAKTLYPIAVKNVRFDSTIEGVPLEDVLCSYEIESQAPDIADRQILWLVRETKADTTTGLTTVIHESGFSKLVKSRNSPQRFEVQGSRRNFKWLADGSQVTCEIKVMNQGFDSNKPEAVAIASGESLPTQIAINRDITIKQAFQLDAIGSSIRVIWQNDGTLIAYRGGQTLNQPIKRIKSVNQVVKLNDGEVALSKDGSIYSLSASQDTISINLRGKGSIAQTAFLRPMQANLLVAQDGRLLSWIKGQPNQSLPIAGWDAFRHEKFKKVIVSVWHGPNDENYLETGILGLKEDGKLTFLPLTADGALYAEFVEKVNSDEHSGQVEDIVSKGQTLLALKRDQNKATLYLGGSRTTAPNQIVQQSFENIGAFGTSPYGGYYAMDSGTLHLWSFYDSSTFTHTVIPDVEKISDNKSLALRSLDTLALGDDAALFSATPLNAAGECNDPHVSCAAKIWSGAAQGPDVFTGVKKISNHALFFLVLQKPASSTADGFDLKAQYGSERFFLTGAANVLSEPAAWSFLAVKTDHSAVYFTPELGNGTSIDPSQEFIAVPVPVSVQFLHWDYGQYLRVGKTAWNLIGVKPEESRDNPFPAGTIIREDDWNFGI